ncbi:MAG: L-seryl-tRNA(Sec) selenium transferase [Deltaproteobacteria bacterium]|nr:L-seryl-tRNA(Sec) selenium transferase [Deltaproteobacteria bacterium]
MPDPDRLRSIPSVASLLEIREIREHLEKVPRDVVLDAVRRILSSLRQEASSAAQPRSREEWTAIVLSRLPVEIAAAEEPSLRSVINATGVVIHTNLGRAPLPEEAIRAVSLAARGYSNLEYDLAAGARSSRLVHLERLILGLTGAESAHVVNNNAAAVLLCLAGLARGRDVLVSRGELVEIGGSFRIPDIMAESGASLVEVGTTNRTRLEDYEKAVTSRTALLLKVHRSNFSVSGFTEEVSPAALSSLGDRLGIPVMEDLGSGAVFDFSAAGIPGTPTIRQALSQGPGIVTVSGDKLLGGPQAGIIAGRKALVEPLKKHPLSRALRIDKLCLAALAATLSLYADERRAAVRVPVLSMLTEGEGAVRARARRFVRRIGKGGGAGLKLEVVRADSSPGGGAMPDIGIPTACVAVEHATVRVEELEERLRRGNPPVVARIGKGKLLLDMRTVRDGEVAVLAAALLAAAADAR